jgi:hyperosmotically inducible periplasmic protein
MRRIRIPVAYLAALLLAVSFAAACGKTAGETIDDATITARVKTSLLNDEQVSGLAIDVDTAKGVVTLSGIVKSQAEADRAVSLTRSVSGVKDVKSTLQVQPST